MGKNSELSTHHCKQQLYILGVLQKKPFQRLESNKETEGLPTKASKMKKVVSPVNKTPTYDPVLDKYILMGVF